MKKALAIYLIFREMLLTTIADIPHLSISSQILVEKINKSVLAFYYIMFRNWYLGYSSFLS